MSHDKEMLDDTGDQERKPKDTTVDQTGGCPPNDTISTIARMQSLIGEVRARDAAGFSS
eukprot:SAG11_NODE_25959_length_351_cov_1.357143_1_plen_58_part_10